MKIGSDTINISKNGKHFYTLLNRRSVFESKSEKDLINRTSPVISALLKTLCKQGNIKEIQIAKKKDYREMLDMTMKGISDNLGNVEVSVLEMVPDEIEDNSPAEVRTANFKDLQSVNENFLSISENIENLKHVSSILLKTNLPKDMWGSKEVTSVFNSVKSNMDSMSDSLEHAGTCAEKSEGLLRYLSSFNEKTSNIQQTRTIVGNILENFSTIKTALSELSQNSHGLYDIDSTFKRCTGYPATWFLNSSILYDFLFEFETLIENLIKMSKIEGNIIGPLLVWKVQQGENK
jgi:methyl-accepting chemotaxis protein